MTKIEFTIKNEDKGYFGCFSKAGKNSAEILTNIRMKESLLNPKKSSKNNKEAMVNFLKRNGYHNIYGDDKKVEIVIDNELNDSVIEDMEEEIDIFKKFKVKNKKNKNEKNKINKNKSKEIKKKYFHRLNAELYKYHDMHLNKRLNQIEIDIPDCAKYEPNKDYVMKRIIGSTEWKTRKGRTPLYKVNNSKIYLNHEHPLKNIVKVFIDMNKQSMRGNFNNSNDVRNITTKSFTKDKFEKRLKKIKTNNNMSTTKSEYLSSDKANTKNTNLFIKYEQNYLKSNKKRIPSAGTSITTRPQTGIQNNLTTLVQSNSKVINNTSNSLIGNRNITSISNINKLFNEDNSSMESLTESNDSYNVYKYVYKKQIKTYNKKNDKIKNIKKFNIFRKSNKKKDKVERPKSSNIKRKLNIKGPDFNKTMTREQYYNLADKGLVIPFSLPNFKQVRERPLTMVVYERPIYKKYTKKEIKGITPDMYNDIYKHLESINNHKRCKTPNFSKMTNYKKNDKNPLPIYMKGMTSRGACDTMNEKNLKMNNFAEGKFLSNYTSFWPKKSFNKIVNLNLLNSKAFLENVLNKEGISHFLKNTLKFYRKNYKSLLKESLLNKFDNVTYKTIKPAIKPDLDLEKFIEKIKL